MFPAISFISTYFCNLHNYLTVTMKAAFFLSLLAVTSSVTARSPRHVGLQDTEFEPVKPRAKSINGDPFGQSSHRSHLHKRAPSYLTNATASMRKQSLSIWPCSD